MRPIVTRKTVLVTGAGGFIGANLVRRLVALDNRVHIFRKKTTNTWRLSDIWDKLSVHDIDLLNDAQVTKTVHAIRPNAIYHLAAHGAYEHQADVAAMTDIGIKGTLNLLFASKDIPYDIFVNTGSSSEYGKNRYPMRETDALDPISFYAAVKASATHLCRVFSRVYNKPVVTLRPFSVYGPYEDPKRLIPALITNVLSKRPVDLTRAVVRHDFIYVDDVVDAYLRCVSKAEKLSGMILNVGNGVQYTNKHIAQTIMKITNTRVPLRVGAFPNRAWDIPYWVADISLARKLLGWRPQYPLEKGLARTIEFLKRYPAPKYGQ